MYISKHSLNFSVKSFLTCKMALFREAPPVAKIRVSGPVNQNFYILIEP